MSNNIIQSLWIGESLSPIEQLCIKSFQGNGFTFHLYCYDVIKNVPDGTILMDAEDIVPSTDRFRIKGGIALFADYFRFKLLEEKGGIWVDMDMVCLKPFEFTEDTVLARESNRHIAIGFIQFAPGDPLVKTMLHRAMDPPHKVLILPRYFNWLPAFVLGAIKRCLKTGIRLTVRNPVRRIKHYSRNTVWGTLMGPTGLTEEYNRSGREVTILTPEVVYPVPYREWERIFKANGNQEVNLNDAIFIHLWNEMMKRHGKFDKFALPAPGSVYASLCERYGIKFE